MKKQKPISKYTVITSFNQTELDAYTQKFIDSFEKNMPQEVDLILYAENCDPVIPTATHRKIMVIHVEKSLSKLTRFKKTYTYDRHSVDIQFIEQLINKTCSTQPTTNIKKKFQRLVSYITGNPTKPSPNQIKIHEKNMHLWDFTHDCQNVYCVVDAYQRVKSNSLIWMDANSIIRTKIPIELLNDLTGDSIFISCVGKEYSHSNYSWYCMNLNHIHAASFFNKLENIYEQAENELFQLPKWNSSYVLDHVINWHAKKYDTRNKNINEGMPSIGHPFTNSILAKYIDQKKQGPQQIIIKSKHSEIIFFLPRLDIPFKKPKKFESIDKLIKKTHSGNRTRPEFYDIKTYWGNFADQVINHFKRRGYNIRKVTIPFWEITPELINRYNADIAFVPHKQYFQFETVNCQIYFYMQVIFKWLFSCDYRGWSSEHSVYPCDYSEGDATSSTFDEYKEKLLTNNSSKFNQPSAIGRSKLIKNRQIPDDDYIFFPCQLPYDESIKYHSNYSEIEVVSALVSWAKEHHVNVVFKAHPANPKSCNEFQKIAYGKYMYWSDASIHDLINHAKAVYTINSGVGFEAMFYNKPIVTFGRIEYDAVTIHASLDNLPEVWHQVKKDNKSGRLNRYKKFVDWYCKHCCVDLEANSDVIDRVLQSIFKSNDSTEKAL